MSSVAGVRGLEATLCFASDRRRSPVQPSFAPMDWSNANISTYCRVHSSLPTFHSCVSSGSALHSCGIRFQRKRALALCSQHARSQGRGWVDCTQGGQGRRTHASLTV